MDLKALFPRGCGKGNIRLYHAYSLASMQGRFHLTLGLDMGPWGEGVLQCEGLVLPPSMTCLNSRPVSWAIADSGSGFTTMRMVPTVVRTLESMSEPSSLKVAWRIDAKSESSVVLGLNRVFPSGTVLSESFKIAFNRCSVKWVLVLVCRPPLQLTPLCKFKMLVLSGRPEHHSR